LIVGAWFGSLLVTVHVSVCPSMIVPEQAPAFERAYPAGPLSPTEKLPALIATVVPGESAPGKEAGLGELPLTVIVKLAGVAVPPSSLVTCLITISFGWMSSLVNVQVLI